MKDKQAREEIKVLERRIYNVDSEGLNRYARVDDIVELKRDIRGILNYLGVEYYHDDPEKTIFRKKKK